jgi:hypothetical protein
VHSLEWREIQKIVSSFSDWETVVELVRENTLSVGMVCDMGIPLFFY